MTPRYLSIVTADGTAMRLPIVEVSHGFGRSGAGPYEFTRAVVEHAGGLLETFEIDTETNDYPGDLVGDMGSVALGLHTEPAP